MSFMLVCDEEKMSHCQHTIHKQLCTYTHTVRNTEQYGDTVKTVTNIHHMCTVHSNAHKVIAGFFLSRTGGDVEVQLPS
jgi:hypothetical protein